MCKGFTLLHLATYPDSGQGYVPSALKTSSKITCQLRANVFPSNSSSACSLVCKAFLLLVQGWTSQVLLDGIICALHQQRGRSQVISAVRRPVASGLGVVIMASPCILTLQQSPERTVLGGDSNLGLLSNAFLIPCMPGLM